MPRCLAFFALLLALGSWGLGFGVYCGEPHETAADAAFHALQMFHLHFHPLHDGSMPLALELGRFGAACFGLGLLPAMLGVSLFRGDWRRFCARNLWRGHVVVCGHCTRTLSLLQDSRAARPGQKRPRVVFIGRCPSAADEVPPGVVHLEGRAQSGELLRDADPSRRPAGGSE